MLTSTSVLASSAGNAASFCSLPIINNRYFIAIRILRSRPEWCRRSVRPMRNRNEKLLPRNVEPVEMRIGDDRRESTIGPPTQAHVRRISDGHEEHQVWIP